ncbi:hypothetical protein ACF0H5_004300 [Mactra antiquata]
MMKTEQILRAKFSDSDVSDSDSDCSSKSGHKKVQFTGFDAITDSDRADTQDCAKEKKEAKKKHRVNKKNSLNVLKINRGDIPDGSELFRQVLKEIQTESDEECLTPRSDSSSSKPLKSILKRKSDL